jgi:lactaldehyde dehydrogenase
LAAHKVGPAIASNNPVVLKPSSLTPLTALKMAGLFLEAGLPPEMLHVVTGDHDEIGDELISNPLVKKITFTGSVPVGKSICEKIGMKRICMELGGNDPFIILEDANIEEAVSCAVTGAFGNNGQRCASIKRIIIEESVADHFTEYFVEKTKPLSVGNQMDPETDIGPLIIEKAAIKVEEAVNLSIADGAKLLYGGKRQETLFWPTVLDYVNPVSSIVVEETFGPVAPVIRVKSFDEAIHVANNTNYGLQAGVFTNSINKAMEAVRRLQVGTVMINNGPNFRAENLPFGGVKDSGLGREGVKYAIEEMTQMKTVIINNNV